MLDTITGVMIDLGITGRYEQLLLLWLLAAWSAVLVIRGFLAAGYKGQLLPVKNTAKKEIKDKADFGKSAFLKRAAKDYAELGERGVARINARELTEKSARSFKLMFWNYSSIESFLDAIEPAFLFAGILLTVLAESKEQFAAVTLIIYAGGRLFASFFDYKAAREELISESAFLLDKELGKLYVTDVSASINNLRTELKNTLVYQAKFLTEAIAELRDKLSAVSEKTLGDTAVAIEKTLASVSVAAGTVEKPLNEWRSAILESHNVQEGLNKSVTAMSGAAEGFRDRTAELAELLKGYKEELLNNNKNVERELERLNNISSSLIEASGKAVAQTSSIESSLEYIRSNQALLESSMNQYELALKEITSSAGDGLGKIISYQMQGALQSLADGTADSIRQANANNSEMMNKLQSLFDRILEQSKSETALILSVKEQMELSIEGLNHPNNRQPKLEGE